MRFASVMIAAGAGLAGRRHQAVWRCRKRELARIDGTGLSLAYPRPPGHNSSLAHPRKNLSMDVTQGGNAAACRNKVVLQEAMGENSKCSNSTSTDRPTRPRSRSSSRKPASPIEPVAVDTRKGDQFKPEYLAINPNAKVPAIDDDGVKVFDSNAILLYPRRKDRQVSPRQHPGQPRRVAVMADVRGHRASARIPARPSLQAFCAGKNRLRP
jgi:hypothetical protein